MKKNTIIRTLLFSLIICNFVVVSKITTKAAEVTTPQAVTTSKPSETTAPTTTREYTNEYDETTNNYIYKVFKSVNNELVVVGTVTSKDLGVEIIDGVKTDVKSSPQQTYVTIDEVKYHVVKKVYKKTEICYLIDDIVDETHGYIEKQERLIGWYDEVIVRKSDTDKAIKLYKKYKNKKKIIIKTNSELTSRRIYAAMLYKYARYSCADAWKGGKTIKVKTKTFKKYIKASKKAIKKKYKFEYKKTKKRQDWMTNFLNYALEKAETEKLECESWSDKVKFTTAMHVGYLLAINKFDLKYNRKAADYLEGKSKKPSKYGNGQSGYEVIDYQTAVCAGIADFTCIYYRSLGIKCKKVIGTEYSPVEGEIHAWNVLPDGVYNNTGDLEDIVKVIDYTGDFSRNGHNHK